MSSVARWISIVGHPFVMAAIMVAGIALHFGTASDALRAVALVGAIAVVPLGFFIPRQVRRGSWSNVDASDRSERPALFAVGIAGLAVLLTVAYVFQPHTFLLRGTLGVLLMLAVCALATKWVKVSLHSAFASLAAATLLLVDSPAAWFLARAGRTARRGRIRECSSNGTRRRIVAIGHATGFPSRKRVRSSVIRWLGPSTILIIHFARRDTSPRAFPTEVGY